MAGFAGDVAALGSAGFLATGFAGADAAFPGAAFATGVVFTAVSSGAFGSDGLSLVIKEPHM